MGEQIGLRTLEKEDLEFLHKLYNNAEIMAYWFEEPYKSMTELKDSFDKNMDNPHKRQFILYKNEKKLGLVELVSIDYIHRKAEFTIIITPEHQGNGYAGTATRLATDYAFLHLNLHKLYLVVDKINEKAIHIYKKCDFEVEAELRDEFFVNGTYHNAVLMSMFNKNYRKMNG